VKLSDYVVERLVAAGMDTVFMITGGGAMHLNDSFGARQGLRRVFNHHEQASAMGAEGYARVTGRTAFLSVTTGPGGINALNGVFGAWTDSIPMVVVSGQVKRETCMGCQDVPGLRQLGDQEVDIIRMVQGITKYAVLVRDPQTIRYHLDRATFLAASGRPGPCWLDIPIDVQSAQVDPDTLPAWTPDAPCEPPADVREACADVVRRLRSAERPVLFPGTGVRLAGMADEFDAMARSLGAPVVPAWTAIDLVPNGHPLFAGRAGTIGDRAGNFAMQNADLVLVLGSRLNIRQVSYNWSSFASRACKIIVDVDRCELVKPMVRPDVPVHADLRTFLPELRRQLAESGIAAGRWAAWVAWCQERVRRYPVVQPQQRDPGRPLNPYHFIELLGGACGEGDIFVCGNGTAAVVTFQALTIKPGQRAITNSGSASMGHDLPAAIGAAIGAGGRRVICLAGDGSLQMNIQEFQTLAHERLPVKVFVLDNGGYSSIRQTQSAFFGRLVGEGPASGVTFPDFAKVAAAYGLPASRITADNVRTELPHALEADGPYVCQVCLDADQPFEPKLSSRVEPDGRIVSPRLEDMAPFLDREELRRNTLWGDR
jgi:acetolactate synthase I/II/III large subunit